MACAGHTLGSSDGFAERYAYKFSGVQLGRKLHAELVAVLCRFFGWGLAVISPIFARSYVALGSKLAGGRDRWVMQYRCVAASPTGFVQQLAVQYLAHGYWFYVQGCIPGGKDPNLVDQKLIHKYGIGMSRQSRARRKSVGIANIHYLRFERTFVLLATHGHHPFYDDESTNIRDARRVPIKFMGYSIGVQQGGYLRRIDPAVAPNPDGHWRARVQIGRDSYQELKAYFLDAATRRSGQQLAADLFAIPFEPYAPVRQQMLNLLRLVNAKRKQVGLQSIGADSLRYRRHIVKPFEFTHPL